MLKEIIIRATYGLVHGSNLGNTCCFKRFLFLLCQINMCQHINMSAETECNNLSFSCASSLVRWSRKRDFWPVVLRASSQQLPPGSLLDTRVLRPQPRPTESQTLGVERGTLTKVPGDSGDPKLGRHPFRERTSGFERVIYLFVWSLLQWGLQFGNPKDDLTHPYVVLDKSLEIWPKFT